jgi:hypothetical protein
MFVPGPEAVMRLRVFCLRVHNVKQPGSRDDLD